MAKSHLSLVPLVNVGKLQPLVTVVVDELCSGIAWPEKRRTSIQTQVFLGVPAVPAVSFSGIYSWIVRCKSIDDGYISEDEPSFLGLACTDGELPVLLSTIKNS